MGIYDGVGQTQDVGNPISIWLIVGIILIVIAMLSIAQRYYVKWKNNKL